MFILALLTLNITQNGGLYHVKQFLSHKILHLQLENLEMFALFSVLRLDDDEINQIVMVISTLSS